jgi:hypothetical protein
VASEPSRERVAIAGWLAKSGVTAITAVGLSTAAPIPRYQLCISGNGRLKPPAFGS